MVQMTFKGNYIQLEKLANKAGGKLAAMFKGVSEDPTIITKSSEANVIASIMYMNFQHARRAIARAKKKESETKMEYLVRKYASGPFGSTIGQTKSQNLMINGTVQVNAASGKLSSFIIVEE
jgi:transcription antitermination factor NusA-like protein